MMLMFNHTMVGDNNFPTCTPDMEDKVGMIFPESMITDTIDSIDDDDEYFLLEESLDDEGWAWHRRWTTVLNERE